MRFSSSPDFLERGLGMWSLSLTQKYVIIVFTLRPHGLVVRTRPSQGCSRGSNPLGAIFFVFSIFWIRFKIKLRYQYAG